MQAKNDVSGDCNFMVRQKYNFLRHLNFETKLKIFRFTVCELVQFGSPLLNFLPKATFINSLNSKVDLQSKPIDWFLYGGNFGV